MAQRAKRIAEENSHHDCDFRDMLSRVGDKWSLLVIFILKGRPAFRGRFSDLKRSIPGISQRMLTATVRNLERDGMLTRHVYAEVPPRVEYELTPLGRGLTEPVLGLISWLQSSTYAATSPVCKKKKKKNSSTNTLARHRSTGRAGLRYAFAHHFDVGTAIGTLDAVALYRGSFRPSVALDEPYMIVTAGVLAAETVERAEYLAAPACLAMLAMRTGRRLQLMSPAEAAQHPDLDVARAMPSNRIVGDAGLVSERLVALLAENTQADELMISTMTHGSAERIETLEIVAEIWARCAISPAEIGQP